MKPHPGQLRVWTFGDGDQKRYGAPFLVLEVRRDNTPDSTKVLENRKIYSVWTRTVEVESEAISEAR
jgi:hypothetical protein